MDLIRKVNLKAIDPEALTIRKLSTEVDTFFVELPLDNAPQEDWQKIFREELKKTGKPIAVLKDSRDSFPKFEVNYPNSMQEDTISITTNPKKLQEDIKLVMQLVETVNDRVDKHNREANEENEKEKLKTESIREIIREMRESLKKDPPTL